MPENGCRYKEDCSDCGSVSKDQTEQIEKTPPPPTHFIFIFVFFIFLNFFLLFFAMFCIDMGHLLFYFCIPYVYNFFLSLWTKDGMVVRLLYCT